MSTTAKKTKKTKGLSGTVKPKKANTLKEKQTRFNKIWDEARGLLKDEFEKGLIKHPV